jgi:hypothetical protein
VNFSGHAVWQQASGDTKRDYGELCLRLGVILNGYDASAVAPPPDDYFFDGGANQMPAPGSPGAINDLRISGRKKQDLRRFCQSMQAGDIVVLRRGTSEVLGVGTVVGVYFHDEHFGDVDGWNIPLARKVSWIWSDAKSPKKFSTYDLKQGDTTQKLKEGGAVWKWIESLPDPPPTTPSKPAKLAAQREVGIEEISEYLFDKGVASGSIRDLVNEIGELERIAKWYERTHQSPSEPETLAYLVVPLLRVLGWTPQKMAVEWKNVDVALFSTLPRSEGSLRVVVEAKKMRASCLTADDQAKRYAAGKDKCHRLILTDGLRYAVYTRLPDGEFKLAAYLNLIRMRDRYPIFECLGAQEALLLMAPEMELS